MRERVCVCVCVLSVYACVRARLREREREDVHCYVTRYLSGLGQGQGPNSDSGCITFEAEAGLGPARAWLWVTGSGQTVYMTIIHYGAESYEVNTNFVGKSTRSSVSQAVGTQPRTNPAGGLPPCGAALAACGRRRPLSFKLSNGDSHAGTVALLSGSVTSSAAAIIIGLTMRSGPPADGPATDLGRGRRARPDQDE